MLDAEEVRHQRLPPTATWFRYLVPKRDKPNASLLEHPCTKQKGAFLVAWHSPFIAAPKRAPTPIFGCFPDLQTFLDVRYDQAVSNFGFEIIQDDKVQLFACFA